jgi:hypothetical protein
MNRRGGFCNNYSGSERDSASDSKFTVTKLLYLFIYLCFVNVFYPFLYRVLRFFFSVIELALRKIFLFYNGPTDNIRNEHLIKIESDLFGDERFAKEVSNFSHYDLFLRPRRWFRPLVHLKTIKSRKEVFRKLIRTENQRRLLRSFFFSRSEGFFKNGNKSSDFSFLYLDNVNSFSFKPDSFLVEVFLRRRSFFFKKFRENVGNFPFLILFIGKFFFFFVKFYYFLILKVKFWFYRVVSLRNFFKRNFNKVGDSLFFRLFVFIFRKLIFFFQYFLLFFFRLLFFFFIFPLFVMSFLIILFFAFVFFFDSVLLKLTPWISHKYLEDLLSEHEESTEFDYNFFKSGLFFTEEGFELKSRDQINEFAKNHRLFLRNTVLKDFFVSFFGFIKRFYLIRLYGFFRNDFERIDLLGPEGVLDEFEYLDLDWEYYREYVGSRVFLSTPLRPLEVKDWWRDIFLVIRRLCVFFYIPLGVYFFVVFFSVFFSFNFFFFIFFLILGFSVRIKLLQFVRVVFYILMGDFIIGKLKTKVRLNGSNFGSYIERLVDFFNDIPDTEEYRRIKVVLDEKVYKYEYIKPLLEKLDEIEKFFFSAWISVLPERFLSTTQVLVSLGSFLDFKKSSVHVKNFLKNFFGFRIFFHQLKILCFRFFSVDLFFFKIFFYKTSFSFFVVFLFFIVRVVLFFFGNFVFFFQIFCHSLILFIVDRLRKLNIMYYESFLRLFVHLNVNVNVFFIFLFKSCLFFKFLKINNLFFRFFSNRNIGILRIIGIFYSMISQDKIVNNYRTFLQQWYNRFLFANNEFLYFKERKATFPVLYFFRNLRKKYKFFKQKTKKDFLSDLKYIICLSKKLNDKTFRKRMKSRTEKQWILSGLRKTGFEIPAKYKILNYVKIKKKVLTLLLKNRLAQKRLLEKKNSYDWYFEDFVFYKYMVYNQLSNFKSVSFSGLWDWVKNYKMNIDAVKDMEKSITSQLVYRNNIPRLESSKIEFYIRSLLLRQYLICEFIFFFSIFLFFIVFFLVFIFFYVDFFGFYLIVFLLVFFFLPFVIYFFFALEYSSFRKVYVGNLLLIFRPISFDKISVFRYCFPFMLNKFFKLRLKNEFKYVKLNYLRTYKSTSSEVLKDFLRLVIVLFFFLLFYSLGFLKFFNVFFFFLSFFFLIFFDLNSVISFYTKLQDLLYKRVLSGDNFFLDFYFFLFDFFKFDFNVFNNVETFFILAFLFFYTLCFFFLLSYLYHFILFRIVCYQNLFFIFGNWIFLNLNPVVIYFCLKKKFELSVICRKSDNVLFQMNYVPKVNLKNLEKELQLVHVTKYLRYQLLKKKFFS